MILLLLLACRGAPPSPDSADRPLSFVLVLTDDQSLSLTAPEATGLPSPTPGIEARIFDQGTRFTQAIVNTPLCCPTRASLLSGGFHAHQTGVRQNEAPQGGMASFVDAASLAVQMQSAGWTTGFLGKYLSDYTGQEPYTPPGWDRFHALSVGEDWSAFTAYVSDGGAPTVAVPVQGYVTDHLSQEALRFLDEVGDAPFFLVIAHHAPHQLAVPAAQDQGAMAGASWRPASFNEADLSDKPLHMQELPPLDEAAVDRSFQERRESLLAVDRGVVALLDALQASGRDQDTVVVYSSDNGSSFGEHRIEAKGHPYDEALRVPLAIRLPGAPAGRVEEGLVSASLDLPATLAALAGIEAPTAGRSLVPQLLGEAPEDAPWQLIQGIRGNIVPDFVGVRSPGHVYVEHLSGEVELYDLEADPDQLENGAGQPELAAVQAELAQWLAPRAPLILQSREIGVEVGEPVDLQLQARGGVPPYTWTAEEALPAGLVLDTDGRLHGLAESGFTGIVEQTVTDADRSPYDGRPQAETVGVGLRAR